MTRMKKIIAAMTVAVVLTVSCASLAENAVGMENPWTEVAFSDLMYNISTPVDVDDDSIVCRSMNNGEMEEMTCTIFEGAVHLTVRAEKTDALTDISGIYGETTEQKAYNMDGYEARYLVVKDGENEYHMLQWYDAAEGVTYCISSADHGARQSLLEEMARQVFAPLTAVPEDYDAKCAAYDEVIASYQKLADDLQSDTVSDEEKATLRQENLPLADCPCFGSAKKDLDKDGTPELIISSECPDDDYFRYMVFAVYTLDENNQPVQVLQAGERNLYYYMGENLFANIGSSGADDSIDTTLAYQNGTLEDLGYASDISNSENLSMQYIK